VAKAVPLLPPEQFTFAVTVAPVDNTLGWVIVTAAVEVQALLSVMVTV